MSGQESETSSLGKTALLLARVRDGDETAIGDLIDIYRPLLERWAKGRIPGHARGLVDTVDVVQVCLVRALDRVDGFDASRPGGFFAYLRQAILNQIRNEIRSAASRPQGDSIEEARHLPNSFIDEGSATVDAYEKALLQLSEEDQAAIVLRLEFGLKYPEIAEVLSRPSANAVRMQVTRALVLLAEKMEP